MLCSMQNWAEDLYFRELDLKYPGVTDAVVCEVYINPIAIFVLHISNLMLLWFDCLHKLVLLECKLKGYHA